MSARTTSILLTSFGLFTAAFGSGAQLLSCYGFSNGYGGYDVNMAFENVQSQSRSSICGNLQKTLKDNYGWCLQNTALNCATENDLLTFGISTNDQTDGFSCVPAAFIHTLQASIDSSPNGDSYPSCVDIDQGTSSKRVKRAEGKKRQVEMDQNVAAAIGQAITVASGNELTLVDLVPEAAGQPAFTTITDYFGTLGTLAQNLGTTGRSMAIREAYIDPTTQVDEIFGQFNAGFGGGAVGNVDVQDYTVMLGAITRYMASLSGGRTQGAYAKFAFTGGALAGATALTLYIYAGVN